MPRLVVLGSGQDAGVPQLGGPPGRGPARTASSLAVLTADGALLFDASPDVRYQQAGLYQFPEYADRAGNVFDAVFLTHAHMGHYAGLIHFGKEAHGSRALPTYGSNRMLQFLTRNEPWATLLREDHLAFEVTTDGSIVDPIEGLSVGAVAVPHRPELSDNFGYIIRSAEGSSVLYLPDLDRWADWPAAPEVIAAVDVALIDGTFFSPGDDTGPNIEEIPHPPIEDTMARFGDLAADTHVVFTHLNHSNPAADPRSDEARRVVSRGFAIAFDGMTFNL